MMSSGAMVAPRNVSVVKSYSCTVDPAALCAVMRRRYLVSGLRSRMAKAAVFCLRLPETLIKTIYLIGHMENKLSFLQCIEP